jgi:hypothetical protein
MLLHVAHTYSTLLFCCWPACMFFFVFGVCILVAHIYTGHGRIFGKTHISSRFLPLGLSCLDAYECQGYIRYPLLMNKTYSKI